MANIVLADGLRPFNAFASFKEQAAAPATPASGLGRLYAKNDGKIYFKNDDGAEFDLTSGGGGGGGWQDDGTVVRLVTATDAVSIGGTTVDAGVILQVEGGNIKVKKASDPAVSVQDTTNDLLVQLIASDNDGFVGTTTNHNFIIRTNSTQRIKIFNDGTIILNASSAAPSDGSFFNGSWAMWLDEANNEFEFKAKKSDGTIFSRTLGAAGGGGWQDDGTVVRLVTTSDNVNIGGTAAPDGGHKLQVESSVKLKGADGPVLTIEDTTNGLIVQLVASDTQGVVGTTTNHDFVIRTNSTQRIKIFNDGTLVHSAANAAPGDGSLFTGTNIGSWAAWIDTAGNKLTFKVKYPDGTVKSGTVGLT